MAAYEQLPIFRKTMELAVYMEQLVARFSRYHKYTLGGELRTLCHECLVLVAEANRRSQRVETLRTLRSMLERLKILMYLAREVRAFQSAKSYGHAVALVVAVSRQNEGWLRHAMRTHGDTDCGA